MLSFYLTQQTAVDYASMGFAVAGVAIFLSAFWPHYEKMVLTRNTVGISIPMFILHALVGFFMFWGAVLVIVSQFLKSPSASAVTNCMFFSILNAFGCYVSTYTVLLTRKNRKEAEKMGLNEIDHYKQVVVPYVEGLMLKEKAKKVR